MVIRRCSSLTHLLDEEIPPPALFAALSKKWTTGAGDDKALETAVRLLHAAVNVSVGARAETGRAPHKLLHTLAGSHANGSWSYYRAC